jgi:hypothetical protein
MTSLRGLSFVQVFEQFDTTTQFNVLTTLMKKMDQKEGNMIEQLQRDVKKAAGKQWKFPDDNNNPYDIRNLQPEFLGPAFKDWEGIMDAQHVAGFEVVICACFICGGKKLTKKRDGFTATLTDLKLNKNVEVKGRQNIIDIFKKTEQELRAMFE